MPYVPSKKTDGVSDDREVIDVAVLNTAKTLAEKFTRNNDVNNLLKGVIFRIGDELDALSKGAELLNLHEITKVVWEQGLKYEYEGAFLGELNYAITMLIQEFPQQLVKSGKQAQALRYFIYALTVQALVNASTHFASNTFGIGGVFEDIKDEYKRRVNTAYEAAQIIKSGDCYTAPYYTRLIELVDEDGQVIGHQEVMLKKSNETINLDVLNHQIKLVVKSVLTKKGDK